MAGPVTKNPHAALGQAKISGHARKPWSTPFIIIASFANMKK
jgi:hypothetical protein